MRRVTDHWLMEAGVRDGGARGVGWDGGRTRGILLSQVFDRWERIGIDIGRPFTVVVDTVGQSINVEQESELG